VTVDRKEGQLTTPSGKQFRILDLPGAYSLNAVSVDEEITRDVVLGMLGRRTAPGHARLCQRRDQPQAQPAARSGSQRLGLPMVLALNMTDLATKRGIEIDVPCPGSASWACRWSGP
jgi:ferrous iron transport protein B